MRRHSLNQGNSHPWVKLFTLVTIGGAAAAYFLRSRSSTVTRQADEAAETSTDWMSEELSATSSNGSRSASNIPGVDPVPPREPF